MLLVNEGGPRRHLDQHAIAAWLAGRNLPWRQVSVVSETASTNSDLLAQSASGSDVSGEVVVAEYQYAGRGRQGRQWSSPPRAQLALSFGVDASLVAASRWGWLPLAAGLAVVDAVREATAIDAGLKWPNDVLVGGRKLAGILAEVAGGGRVIIVGVGLNVTLSPEELPDPNATSLTMLGAGSIDRTELLERLLLTLARRLEQWRGVGPPDDELSRSYLCRSVTIGRQVRAMMPGGQDVLGQAEGIDGHGRLLIDTGTDTIAVSAGDIVHLRPLNAADLQ